MTIYICHDATGGSTSSVNGIDGDDLAVNDVCIMVGSTYTKCFLVDENGAAANPPGTIVPAVNPGDWNLVFKPYFTV